ncbi:MAG: signal peptidase II [Spirochaetaceae bacterium]|jgi:signal peptidase II|nr:signal peptidase II [Spirochaetaceae bacterium]
MKRFYESNFFPFLLTGLVIAADQGVKSFIVKNWPDTTGRGVFIKDVFDNGLLWILHVRNKAIAFSLGHNLPDSIRPALFIIIPLFLLVALIWYYFKSNEITPLQRWVVAGIIGGGIGNLIDRIFRPQGVVDYISVRFFGIFGLERWPTFNIADASVVVSCIVLLCSIIFIPASSKAQADA